MAYLLYETKNCVLLGLFAVERHQGAT